jgi:hypothetical protein
VAERVEGDASVYTVAVESSDHGYIASLILFKTTIDNLILRLRNIGSLVPKVIQKISLLMQSYTSSEKWQSLVNPFRGVSREVPMLISGKNWLLSVEPFRGVSREMTTSGLSSEVQTYAGTCQMDECRIMMRVAMDRVHLTARCTGVSSPCIMYITRSLVLMLHASGRCTVLTYEYYWGKYPVLVVLYTVVLLYLNSAERAHMYLNTCTYPDTCKHERTPVTLNVLGVEMLKILSDCKIGYECGKILSEKQDRLEGTGRLLYSGARRSRRLYLRRRQKERPGDTRILVQSVESCIDQCTRLKDPCRGLHGKLKAEAQLKQ